MANGRRDDVVITIEAEEETQWLLHPSAGNESCCIFRVPQCLVEINTKTYQPHIVSIGPYHSGKPHLQMMQQHKGRYFRDLLARTPPTGPKLDDYLQAVASREHDIRRSYSETINLCSRDLVEMMVLDGLFTIELFCKVARLSPSDPDDAIFNLGWVFPNLIRDLLRLENQIPFFVLQILLDKSKASRKEDSQSSLAKLALEFINHAVETPPLIINQQFKVEAKHLLDLVRLSFIPQPPDQQSHPPQDKKLKSIPFPLVHLIRPLKVIKSNTRKAVKKLLVGLKPKTMKGNTNTSSVELIQSAKKLFIAGIKLKSVEASSFLDIKFHKGVLKIPNILLDNLRTDLFLNFVAFEQCYFHCSKHITTYAAFMSCLVRTPADATFLCDRNIIENYLGTNEEVADFFRNLSKDVPFDIDQSFLCNLFNDVNNYQRNVWRVRWAGFKFTYFDTPWSFLSASAALILLLLTVLQAFYAVYAFYHPQQ
ncbi:hypothetical protein M0R45_005781 [Rubus argutus]|uniref:Uncharacterized protein n=1 Tax=Rubus argutus TaxID=59490 RepID=A0AAW1YNN0_RUBAR